MCVLFLRSPRGGWSKQHTHPDALLMPDAAKKDPGVPNSFPYKDEVLQEAAARKARLEEERERQKEERRRQLQERRQITTDMSMTEIARFAERQQREFEKKVERSATLMVNEKGVAVKGARAAA